MKKKKPRPPTQARRGQIDKAWEAIMIKSACRHRLSSLPNKHVLADIFTYRLESSEDETRNVIRFKGILPW
jgi:hypothetical protein